MTQNARGREIEHEEDAKEEAEGHEKLGKNPMKQEKPTK
jgi:hypothetical protein